MATVGHVRTALGFAEPGQAAMVGEELEVSAHLAGLDAVERLLQREAQEAGISVSDEETQAYLDEIKRQNNVDDEGFEELLEKQGFTLDEYLTQVRRDIVRTRILSMRVRKMINIVPEDVERFLEDHPELRPPEERQPHHREPAGAQLQHRPSDRLLLNWSGYLGDGDGYIKGALLEALD